MAKMIKLILFFIMAAAVLAIGGCAVLFRIMDDRNKNYWEYAGAKGEIETMYTALGSYDVAFAEFPADGRPWQKYEVWYPSDIDKLDESDRTTYPIVVMANGTGVKASQYEEVFRHLASWGFIVAGNEDGNSRTGESSAATLDFILELCEDKNSVFYGRADTGNIGIGGHTQGGVGAMVE